MLPRVKTVAAIKVEVWRTCGKIELANIAAVTLIVDRFVS